MADLLIDAAVCNHKGKVRVNNEDNFYFNGQLMPLEKMDEGGCFAEEFDAGTQLYAVCDGMGGEAAGEHASYMAVSALGKLQTEQSDTLTEDQLSECLNHVSAMIYEEAHALGVRSGTTYAGCWWRNGHMLVAHIGDSRVYRMRSGKLEPLTTDHSVVQRMVSMGLLTQDAARTHPKRHVISQYLGMPVDDVGVTPTCSAWLEGKAADRYLICSDGLTDMLDNTVIEQTLSQATDARNASMMLVQAALHRGGRDNVTVLCLFLKKRRDTDPWSVRQKALLGGGLATGLLGLIYLAEWVFRML